MGRPSKLTDERAELVLAALRAGNHLTTAARYAGIAESTLHAWRRRSPEFSAAVDKARADAEARMVGVVMKAASEHWQAAAWWLERSFPDRYGRRVLELGGKVDTGLGALFEQIASRAHERELEAP
jgi:transposase